MGRILSFSKIRKYNIPLIYPPIQSGKSFFSSKLSVEFLFHKHSPSKFIGIFNVLKLWLHFWPQLFLSPLKKKLKTCSFSAPSTLQRSFFHFLWTEIFSALVHSSVQCVGQGKPCVWAENSALFAPWQFSSPSHLIYGIKANWIPDKLRSRARPSRVPGAVVPPSELVTILCASIFAQKPNLFYI